MKRSLETRDGKKMNPSSLKSFLSGRLTTSLEGLFTRLNLPSQVVNSFSSVTPKSVSLRSSTPSLSPLSSFSADMIDNIEQSLLEQTDVNPSLLNKTLNQKGQLLQKAFHAMTINEAKTFFKIDELTQAASTSPTSISPSSSLADEILGWYDAYLKSNQQIFTDIQKQHQEVIEKSWNDILERKDGLLSYQAAAEAMGSKKWVKESNLFMLNFLIGFYCQGGAARFFYKHKKEMEYHENTGEQTQEQEQEPVEKQTAKKDKEVLPSVLRLLAENLSKGQSDPTSIAGLRPIKILDVGSCYNPLARFDESKGLEVTALDLSPACPSVIPCDFLRLKVETSSDSFIAQDEKEDPSGFLRQMQSNNISKVPMEFNLSEKKLTKLLGGSYDVIIMSLVLCYLPSSVEREVMVKNARDLLIKYDAEKQKTMQEQGQTFFPHDRSLLLISEKQSILLPNNYKNSEMDSVEEPKLKKKSHNKQYKVPMQQLPSISDWKLAFFNLGFDLISYRLLPSSDGKFSHVFLLALSNEGVPVTPRKNKNGVVPDLSIKQDYAADR